ncbi:MAG: beta-ketoacyl-[acyl-carrier-protein] synthase family protein [Actinomycetota bacterium]|nr:beta-ketoacyl-[acyl-carrier-protein] synthase family protein [Actinomycetota bacterium]
MIAITGVGAVTPFGGAEETWKALLAGESALRPASAALRAAGCEVAGPAEGFDPAQFMDRYHARHMGRFSQFAVAASRLAVQGAGVDLGDGEGVGLVVHTGAGGLIEAEAAAAGAATRPHRVSPYFTPTYGPNMAACQPSIELGVRGPVLGGVGACAAGIQAVIDGLRLLQHGEADIVVAGGTDAALSPLLLGSLANAGALAPAGPDPAAACRPFDRSRAGMVASEGAAMFVLEPLDHARRRGAQVLALLAGGGRSADGYHVTAPHPEGRGTAAALSRAVADAGLDAADVDVLVAHATATPRGDEAEAAAVRAVFGEMPQLRVTAPKAALGHGLGAAGAFGVLVAVCCLRDQLVPPTRNLVDPDPDCGPLDHVRDEPRSGLVRHAIVNAAGFGGQNAAVVLSAVAEDDGAPG